MKKILIFVAIFIFCIPVFSQIQVFTKYTDGGQVEPDINFFGYGPELNKTGSVKLSYFGLVEKAWAEGLLGVSYSPVKWCELGLMGGIETNPNIWRTSVSASLNSKKLSFSTCWELGGGHNNWWQKTVLGYTLNEQFQVGLMSWRFNGTGPFIKYSTSNGINLWVQPGYDFEFGKKKLVVGVDVKI